MQPVKSDSWANDGYRAVLFSESKSYSTTTANQIDIPSAHF